MVWGGNRKKVSRLLVMEPQDSQRWIEGFREAAAGVDDLTPSF